MVTEEAVLASVDLQDRELMALAPPLFHELVPSGVPLRALIVLAYRFGGTSVYVPSSANERSKLTTLLYPGELSALCKVAAGEYLGIPRASRLRRELRNRWVMKLLSAGESTRQVALKAQLTQRCIFRIAHTQRRHAAKQLARNPRTAAPGDHAAGSTNRGATNPREERPSTIQQSSRKT